MKIDKKGRLKLEKNEYEVGNYVVKEENDFIKVMDKAGMMSWRVNSLYTGKGMVMKLLLDNFKRGIEDSLDVLKNFIFVDHYALSAVVYGEDMLEIVSKYTELIKRHPDLYGLNPDKSDEEDAKDLEAVKDLHNLAEEIEKKTNMGS